MLTQYYALFHHKYRLKTVTFLLAFFLLALFFAEASANPETQNPVQNAATLETNNSIIEDSTTATEQTDVNNADENSIILTEEPTRELVITLPVNEDAAVASPSTVPEVQTVENPEGNANVSDGDTASDVTSNEIRQPISNESLGETSTANTEGAATPTAATSTVATPTGTVASEGATSTTVAAPAGTVASEGAATPTATAPTVSAPTGATQSATSASTSPTSVATSESAATTTVTAPAGVVTSESLRLVPSRVGLTAPKHPLSNPVELERPPPQIYPEESTSGLAEDLGIFPEDAPTYDEGQGDPEKLGPKLIPISPLFIPRGAKDVLSRADYSLDKSSGPPMSLEELLSRILGSHPDIAIVASAVFEKKGDLMLSKGQGAPQMGLNLSIGPEWTEYPQTEDELTLNYGSASAYISQTVFDFGAIRKDIESSKYSIRAAKVNLRKAIDDIAFAIAMLYLDVLQAQENVHIRRKEVSFYQSLKHAYALRFEAGESSISDVQKMDVSLQTAESQLVGALQRLRMSKDSLETLLDEEKLGIFEVDPQLFVKIMNAPLDSLIDAAEKASFAIIAVQHDIHATQLKIDSLERDKLPKFGYKLSTAGDGEEEKPTVNYAAQATVAWVFSDGGQREGQIVKVKALLRRYKSQEKSIKIQLTDRVKNAYNDYQAASKELELARNAKEASILLTNNYFQEIDLGVRTLLDLVSAKEGEVQAELRETNTRFRRVSALMRLYLEVGLLSDFLPISESTISDIIKSFGIKPTPDMVKIDKVTSTGNISGPDFNKQVKSYEKLFNIGVSNDTN